MILDLLFLLLQLMAGALVASDNVSLTRGIINFGDRCSLGLLQANGRSGTEVESLTALSLFDSGFIFLSFFRRVGFSLKSLPSSSVESTIASFFDSFFTLLEMDSSSLLSVQSSRVRSITELLMPRHIARSTIRVPVAKQVRTSGLEGGQLWFNGATTRGPL